MDAPAFEILMREFFKTFVNDKISNFAYGQYIWTPSHTVIETNTFILENNINHRKAQAQSPDFNPIEIVWNDLKAYLCTV